MYDQIILLLSNHRHPNNSDLPLTLTKHQIISLLRASVSPNQSQEQLQTEIQETLGELRFAGEIYAGRGNRYCMTPPTVLTDARDNLTGLRFRGDRAYLPLVHQILKTDQNHDELCIRPQIRSFERIKQRLTQAGIRCLTVADSIEYLPYPQKPSLAVLRCQVEPPSTSREVEPPISRFLAQPESEKNATIQQYVPRRDTSQKHRWIPLHSQQLPDETLLHLATGEYLWFQDRAFYELEPDSAILAMFYQDKQTGYPLKIQWDKPQGRLNLQNTSLPSAYAQLVWGLSEADKERYRTRIIPTRNHPLIESIFQRLGCFLV